MRNAIRFVTVLLLVLAAIAGSLYLTNPAPTVPPIPFARVVDDSRPYVVKLHAQWCPVCMTTKSVWSQIESTYAASVNLVVFDFTSDATTERSRQKAKSLGLVAYFDDYVGTTGTISVLSGRSRQEVASIHGSRNFADYREAIDAALEDAGRAAGREFQASLLDAPAANAPTAVPVVPDTPAAAVDQTPVRLAPAAAIDAARRAVVREIDPTLPATAFEAWLRGIVGAQAETTWEANDCGEQTGDPAVDRGRDFPVCAEVRVRLEGNRELSLSLVVGTIRQGLTGTPQLWSGYLARPGGLPTSIKGLAQVPGIARAGIVVSDEAGQLLATLRQRLAEIAAVPRQSGSLQFDRDLDLKPLVGLSRDLIREALGPASIDCRAVSPVVNVATGQPARIAPCQADEDLAYSFYRLPSNTMGGGTELLLQFDRELVCIRAVWRATQ